MFCYTSCTWAVQLIRGAVYFAILSAGSKSSESSSVFSGVFEADKVDGVGEKASGDTTTVDVQTLLDAF
jgi:hypothetical protein